MRAVLFEVPEAMLAERHRLGLDGRDEVWNGVPHVVPPAGGPHQRLDSDLLQVLAPLSKRRGLVASYETGLFCAADDYRVPDQFHCRPEHESERGVEGAELVVETRSKGDETYEKIDFYASLGVREMLIVHPQGRWVELLRAVGDRLLPVTADVGARCVRKSSVSSSPLADPRAGPLRGTASSRSPNIVPRRRR
ncbi:MAG: Uma2 family endonuclease [Pseudonocardiaceae bacterium]